MCTFTETAPSKPATGDVTAPSSVPTTWSNLSGLTEVNGLISKATRYSIFTWVVLVVSLYSTTPPHELVYLSESERTAAMVALLSLLMATFLLMMPFVLRRRKLGALIWAALATQTIAIITNAQLAFCPTIVRIDAVTRSPVYLVRWCEWIPLAGLMTFLSEAVALQKKGNKTNQSSDYKAAIRNSVAQSLSCLTGGLICAYCNSYIWWAFHMSISFATWAMIFPRVFTKRQSFFKMKFLRNPIGVETDGSYRQLEFRDRLRFSYHLILTCSVVWTILVVLYCINAYIYRILPPDHPWKDKAPAMIVDTFFDVLAKALYLRCIVEVHLAVFDGESRIMRQLTELRNLMTILWDTSSDVIVVSVKDDSGNLVSILSPAVFDLMDVTLPSSLQDRSTAALMIEMQLKSSDDNAKRRRKERCGVVKAAQLVDTSEATYSRWTIHTILEEVDPSSFVATTASSFVTAAWEKSTNATSFSSSTSPWNLKPHSFVTEKDEDRKTEIKVSNYGSGAIVGVIRDVTERFRWYEAERRAHAEVIRRQQDAQSQTRFVRHEVKNGLLAGIELCDSLRNEIEGIRQSTSGSRRTPCVVHRHSLSNHSTSSTLALESMSVRSSSSSELDSSNCIHSRINAASNRVIDLDLLLHEVLETVLHEAMARDVIHEVYEPRAERLDVLGVLSSSVSTKSGKSDRFPIRCEGEIPFLEMDSQLLKYIHRNAVSNASKYGKACGNVETVLSFDGSKKLLTMKVINVAGENQELIRKQSKEDYNRIVFSQGSTLHGNWHKAASAISSGDGAWIMQKCAKTMGGSCSISFDEDVTIFSFEAPVQPLLVPSEVMDPKEFEVPAKTIGIAVDDSKIQRKLMGRILTYTGVKTENSHILGESPSEVMGLKALVLGLLQDNPDSKMLILIDENLDYYKSNTVDESVALSGSIIMQDILRALSPEQERRILALVRSANDSTTDVQMYIERTHGFFPKAPMLKDRVREIICPLWAGKFCSSS
ncbi:hypothetical protein IV203_032363 [Nitzschia inconspicua]|uniref:Uncharacterized protein n=1 Tax=Nitzschia inconspicua TaxID=303405 RepID=A0A9K3K4H5_9STRA|nr:hypothetical protein IV203_020510 [Nitzschia inconspicua]KAG7344832.1 hypothetical protein IV203_032363 [Nitzschia inconspicua]